MNKQHKVSEENLFKEFLQQPSSDLMKELGFTPTINLNSRAEKDKEANIIGKVDIGDINVPVNN